MFLQKSHDFELGDPKVESCHRLVQVRSAAARTVSNYKLFLASSPLQDSRAVFEQFALREFYYYAGFWGKWVASSDFDSLMLYDDLVVNTRQVVSRLFDSLGITVSEQQFVKALETETSLGGKGQAFNPVPLAERIEWVDSDWIKRYEVRVAAACQGYTKLMSNSS